MFLLRVRGAFVCFLLRLLGGFTRGTAMADFHIYGRIDKNGMGWAWLGLAVSVPDNETVKNSGLARLGSDRVGLATERVGNSGDSAGALGR